MKIIVDHEAQQVLTYLVDAALKLDGLVAHNKIGLFLNSIQPFSESKIEKSGGENQAERKIKN